MNDEEMYHMIRKAERERERTKVDTLPEPEHQKIESMGVEEILKCFKDGRVEFGKRITRTAGGPYRMISDPIIVTFAEVEQTSIEVTIQQFTLEDAKQAIEAIIAERERLARISLIEELAARCSRDDADLPTINLNVDEFDAVYRELQHQQKAEPGKPEN